MLRSTEHTEHEQSYEIVRRSFDLDKYTKASGDNLKTFGKMSSDESDEDDELPMIRDDESTLCKKA